MYTIFFTTLTNEIIGLLPITFIQASYIFVNSNIKLYEQISTQLIIALAFSIGNFSLYFLGKYGSVPFLKIFRKYKFFSRNKQMDFEAKFWMIILMRAIPFFPAKHISIALGVIRYNVVLFFISSLIGIFLRGMILVFLFELGFKFIK
ncbi:VTT domain-containing protein [Arenimonas sp.]|nr:VTT domain-containing protein [Candidatus Parcubacteria bacterium]